MWLILMPERFELLSCSVLAAQATSRERLERSARARTLRSDRRAGFRRAPDQRGRFCIGEALFESAQEARVARKAL